MLLKRNSGPSTEGVSLKRVIAVPRNGYANRLQTMASTSILASEFGAEFSVCWLVERAAPAPHDVIFSPATSLKFEPEEALIDLLGHQIADFPRYVNWTKVAGAESLVTFAGHDRGEQPLMAELLDCVTTIDPDAVVVLAGGRFSTEAEDLSNDWDSEIFREERARFYDALEFADVIDSTVTKLTNQPFIGLHLRYSDRSHQVPSRSTIRKAILNLSEQSGLSRVFIASDSGNELNYWFNELPSMGLTPWTVPQPSFQGLGYSTDIHAIVDWRILAKAKCFVYFSASSFGYEAAVAGRSFNSSIGLDPSPLVSVGVKLQRVVSNVVTAPKRRGWI